MSNIDDERDNDVQGKQVQENGNDANDEDDEQESFDDDSYNDSYIDLGALFENTSDSLIEYVHTRDSTGRVVAVECRRKIPGTVPDPVEWSFKQTGQEDKDSETEEQEDKKESATLKEDNAHSVHASGYGDNKRA
jgi:hypothetical protein